MTTVERYSVFELLLEGPGSPALAPAATFTLGSESHTIHGFWDGEGRYLVRFLPQAEGEWRYTADWQGQTLEGGFTCVPNTGANHGPVRAEGHHFRYADGSRYLPVGTTCYAWTHQTPELIAQTLDTLADAPFNKIRMCVFPKSMPYNNNDPDLYPFAKTADGKWDVNTPDPAFWRQLEDNIRKLGEMGIEADLILFHPYDRWGFMDFPREENLIYLDYCLRRLASFRNVWWSLANEYDLVFTKTIEDWDAFGEKVAADDPYGHLVSVHNCFGLYPRRDWITHCSIQTKDAHNTAKWVQEYSIPVVIDEVRYEGTIEFEWGNISAFEMASRFWIITALGGYCTHGETFHREDEVLWWAKGGTLHGQSPARIAFLRSVLESLPGGGLEYVGSGGVGDPNAMRQAAEAADNPFMKAMAGLPEEELKQVMAGWAKLAAGNGDCLLWYHERNCPVMANLQLPVDGSYRVEVIDIWEMTRKTAAEAASGATCVDLPGKEGIAVLATRLSGPALDGAVFRQIS